MMLQLRRLNNSRGFAMPTVMFLIVIMAFVAYAALMQSNNNLNLVYKQSYLQMARVASKAAIDYSQEQFDSSTCGTYDGTAEQELVSTDTYRVTFKADVLETSADGYEKIIRGTGSIYLPKTSATAKYVFDIRSEIVRTYALCKSPTDFNPLLWLDASDTDTLFKSTASSNTVSSSTTYGDTSLTTRDTVEERVDNGSQTTGSWQSPDLELHECDPAEFSNAICSSNSTRYQYGGVVFKVSSLPSDATITTATLKLTGGTPSGRGGSLTERVYGLYSSSTNPHLGLFTQSGSSQVRTPITTPSLRTTAYKDVTTNNFPPGNTYNIDVTAIVQEMVDHPNWNSSNGNIGFGIQRQSGNGTRRACKGNTGGSGCTTSDEPQLVITYGATTTDQAQNGDPVSEWHDKSNNLYHAIATHGNLPTRVDNQIDGKTILRFNNGDMLSTITNALQDKREMTILAVVKPNFSSSSSDARFVSGMSSSQTNDTTSGSSIIPLLRNANSSGFSSLYAGSSGSYRTDFTCGTSCAGQPYIVSGVFRANENNIDSVLKGNGQDEEAREIVPPTVTTPPYTFDINQLYIGGRRSGSMPGGGVNYFNGDYAEIVVYDYALSCRYIDALEEYLRNKWDIYDSPAVSTCPANTIPVL